MPTYRWSSYFQTKDNEGWSENYYLTAADIASAAGLASANIAPRMALSPNNVDMVYGKVSDVAIKGDSLIVLPMSGSYPFVGTYTETPTGCFLEANTALLIEILAGATHKNRVFLRGLSLDVVTGREFLNPSGFATAINAWTSYLSSGVLVRTEVVPHTVPKTYTYTPSDNAYVKGVTARKPGRPFDLPRGRKFAHR